MSLSPYDFMGNDNEKDVFDCQPPYCNTGAVNTQSTYLIACVDWLSVTFTRISDVHYLFYLLDLQDIENDFILSNGLFGYRASLRNYKGITFLFDGDDGMGCHLQITGQGCRYLETLNNFNWTVFFNYINDIKVFNVTRVDLAIDDFYGYFKLSTLSRKIKAGECISKFKKAINIETLNLKDGNSEGLTIYYGKPTSRLQIRMYEKNHEMNAKGYENNFKVWNRTELQLRDDRAQEIFEKIKDKDDISEIIIGVLTNYIRFTNKNNKDNNRSRWETWKPWEKFINGIESIQLTTNDNEIKLLEDSVDWVIRQVSPTLAMLHKAGIPLEEILLTGIERMNKEHRYKLKEYVDRNKNKNTNIDIDLKELLKKDKKNDCKE